MRYVCLLPLILAAHVNSAAAEWAPVRKVEGIQVEGRENPSGFNTHRAEVFLCTGMSDLAAYIADTSRYDEWIPNLEQVRLLEASADSVIYYMKSKAPWPVKPRDMVYQLTDLNVSPDALELAVAIKGLPAYLPESKEAYRMREAAGEWRIVPEADGLRVTHQFYVDPGNVPKLFANRSMATSLAKTLINLARQFPCQLDS